MKRSNGSPPSHRPPLKSIDAGLNRDAVAEAVHIGVCEFTESDGFSEHDNYVVAATMLLAGLSVKLGGTQPYLPHVGKLYLHYDPRDPDHGYLVIDGYTWLATPDRQVIELSARHYDRYPVAWAGRRWERPAPPTYIWAPMASLPEWVKFEPDPVSTKAMRGEIGAAVHDLEPLLSIVAHHYHRLCRGR